MVIHDTECHYRGQATVKNTISRLLHSQVNNAIGNHRYMLVSCNDVRSSIILKDLK